MIESIQDLKRELCLNMFQNNLIKCKINNAESPFLVEKDGKWFAKTADDQLVEEGGIVYFLDNNGKILKGIVEKIDTGKPGSTMVTIIARDRSKTDGEKMYLFSGLLEKHPLYLFEDPGKHAFKYYGNCKRASERFYEKLIAQSEMRLQSSKECLQNLNALPEDPGNECNNWPIHHFE